MSTNANTKSMLLKSAKAGVKMITPQTNNDQYKNWCHSTTDPEWAETFNKLSCTFALLKTISEYSKFENEFKNNKTYRTRILSDVEFIKDLKGTYKTKEGTINANEVVNNITKYIDSLSPNDAEEDAKNIQGEFSDFLNFYNQNQSEIDRVCNQVLTGNSKSGNEKTVKGLVADMVLNGFEDEDGKIRTLNGYRIPTGKEEENENDGPQDNEPETDGSTADSEDAGQGSDSIPDELKQGVQIPSASAGADTTVSSLSNLLSHFDFNYTELLGKLRSNPQYDFSKEFQYFDQAQKQINDLEGYINKYIQTYPQRQKNLENVKAYLKPAITKIGKIKTAAADLVKELTRMRYIADGTANKYHKKILLKLYEASQVVSDVYKKTIKACAPVMVERNKKKREFLEKELDEFLVNTVLGRHFYYVASEKLRNWLYNSQMKKAEKWVPKDRLKDLMKEYTEAFNTRDSMGRITPEAYAKLANLKREIKKAGGQDDKEKFSKIRESISNFFSLFGGKSEPEQEQTSNAKSEQELKNAKVQETTQKTLNNIERNSEPKEEAKENKEQPSKPEIKENPVRGSQLSQEILKVFDEYKRWGSEINRRKVLRLLKELKETDTKLFKETMEKLNVSGEGAFSIPKSETGRIEPGYKKTDKEKTGTPAGNSLKTRIKDWIQNKIDNIYQRKVNEDEDLDESIAGAIATGIVTAAIGIGTFAVVAAGTSFIITGCAKRIIKMAKFTKKCWTELGKEFTEQDVERKVAKLANSKDAKKIEEKIDKIEDKYYEELHEVYTSIDDKNWEEASENFRDLSSGLQNNPDIIKAVINKISAVVGEPPLYINSPGNETYQAIKKIINIKVAKSAAEAVRKAIE